MYHKDVARQCGSIVAWEHLVTEERWKHNHASWFQIGSVVQREGPRVVTQLILDQGKGWVHERRSRGHILIDNETPLRVWVNVISLV